MVSPVKSRPTHYDNLGLTPAATPDEIAEAFAKRIPISITSPEEAVEHAENIYIAYETLRDPISRRAYDAAIGIWDQQAAAEREVKPFIGARESPEHGRHVTFGGQPASTKKDRGQARPTTKPAIDREVLGIPRPRAKARHLARRPNKAALEWPVPKAKSLGERA